MNLKKNMNGKKMNKSISLPFKILLLLSSVMFLSCDMKIPKKDDFASWTTKIEVPMLEKTIKFDDIIEDSLINPMDSLYTFTKEVEVDTVEVGDKLEIEDIQKSFTQNVDDVTVEDSEVEERIGFNAVGISPINQLITSEIGNITLNSIPEKPTSNFIFSNIYPEINNTDLFPDGTHDIPSIDVDEEDEGLDLNSHGEAGYSS